MNIAVVACNFIIEEGQIESLKTDCFSLQMSALTSGTSCFVNLKALSAVQAGSFGFHEGTQPARIFGIAVVLGTGCCAEAFDDVSPYSAQLSLSFAWFCLSEQVVVLVEAYSSLSVTLVVRACTRPSYNFGLENLNFKWIRRQTVQSAIPMRCHKPTCQVACADKNCKQHFERLSTRTGVACEDQTFVSGLTAV